MGAREAWLHYRSQCVEQVKAAEDELASYADGLRISQWRAGEEPVDTTEVHIGHCKRLIDLYTAIINKIDEDHLA